MATDFEISYEDARALRNALKIYLNETRDEASHTDNPEYRAGIREDIDRIEAIVRKLDNLINDFDRRSAHVA